MNCTGLSNWATMSCYTPRKGESKLFGFLGSPSPILIYSVYDKQPIVDVKGMDIFGNSPLAIKKNIDCLCPNCSRTLGAQKFAPHLEKCMGMGRNSTRIAANNKK